MTSTWEYKVLTLKHSGGSLRLTNTPEDNQATAALNREGSQGWELVNAVCVGPLQPTLMYFKRPR